MATTVAFPGAQVYFLVSMVIGAMIALLIVAGLYIRMVHRRLGNPHLSRSSRDHRRIETIGLSKKAEDVLKEVMHNPRLQNELPDLLDVSKATVSLATSELHEEGLIKKKKKAQTYLIEPDHERLDELLEEPEIDGSRMPLVF